MQHPTEHVVLPAELWARLDSHLRAAAPLEDGAFLLLREGRGPTRCRLLAVDLLLPPAGAWEARGGHQLRPTGQWLSAVIGEAIDAGTGLAFVHSHPDARHPATLSPIDRQTSVDWARTIAPTLEATFASLVWTPAGAAGWAFQPEHPTEPLDIDIVEVVGRGHSRWIHPRPDQPDTGGPIDDRQIRAVGQLGNARLRELTIAVVGAGGTGSPLADMLTRMGVEHLIVIDPDTLDTPSNIRRVVGSTLADIDARTPKVEAVGRHLAAIGLGTTLDLIPGDVRRLSVARTLLDADVVFVTTDNHSSRAVVNQIASQYWVPVIDIGLKVGTDLAGVISGMPADIRVLLPDTACLWCDNVLDAARIRAENLPPNERAGLVAEGYVQALDEPQPSLAPLNSFAASLALVTMLRLFNDSGVLGSRTIGDGWEHYFADNDPEADPRCLCASWRGRANDFELPVLPG